MLRLLDVTSRWLANKPCITSHILSQSQVEDMNSSQAYINRSELSHDAVTRPFPKFRVCPQARLRIKWTSKQMNRVKTFIIAELTWMTNLAFWGRRTKNKAPVFHFGSSESLMTGVLTSRPSQLIKAYGSGAETTQAVRWSHQPFIVNAN